MIAATIPNIVSFLSLIYKTPKENAKIKKQNVKVRKSLPQRGNSAILIFNF
jgi:hypothetical protein